MKMVLFFKPTEQAAVMDSAASRTLTLVSHRVLSSNTQGSQPTDTNVSQVTSFSKPLRQK